MKPTTIKTQTTKRVGEMRSNEYGTIDIGGVAVVIGKHGRLLYLRGFEIGTLDGKIDDAQVTVTDTREMTVRDLQVGDAFVVPEDIDSDAVCICIEESEGEYVRALRLHNNRVTTVRLKKRGDPITLVDVEFEAEPVDEERTVPVSEADGEFKLAGEGGIVSTVVVPRFVVVEWGRESGNHALPKDTPVTVRKPAAYDSTDDVSVGDVVMNKHTEHPGIVLARSKSDREHFTVMYDGKSGISVMDGHWYKDFKPARLTSVTWTPREEVTR